MLPSSRMAMEHGRLPGATIHRSSRSTEASVNTAWLRISTDAGGDAWHETDSLRGHSNATLPGLVSATFRTILVLHCCSL